jgi:dTDP-4-amino-4,6-dideoxygalactose transaminase
MIDLFRPYISDKARMLVQSTLMPDVNGRTYVGEGPRVAEFEKAFAEHIGVSSPVLALNSCTSALDLALHLCGVGPGDEVITTPMTCTATNTHIVLRGATPVWADVDPVTGLIDPEALAYALYQRIDEGRRPKVIIAVDWGGRLCDYDAIRDYANRVQIPIIQDAAHNPYGHGGDYVCYSFQAIKHLTTGDGGALLVPPGQYERARLLRWYGLSRDSSESFRCSQNIQEAGFKYHMNDIAASIGLGNLPDLPTIVQKHRQNAEYYHAALEGVPGITPPPPDLESCWWLYTLLCDDRDDLIAWLGKAGIAASPVHARNDTHDAFHFPNGDLPGVDSFSSHEVAIPVGWWVTPAERATVVGAVRAWAYSHMKVYA